jgi:hypothetical protein
MTSLMFLTFLFCPMDISCYVFLVSDSIEEYKAPSYVPQPTDVHIMYINF